MSLKNRGEPVRIGWMETFNEEISQYHCPGCDEIFQYASDAGGTTEPPKYCPICGRMNLQAD